MKRDATQTIWRTVVFAGAMLGAPACSKKAANTTPSNNAAPAASDTAAPTTDPAMATDTPPPADPCAGDPCAGDPCAGMDRPRGVDDDDEGGGMGRGFVLS